MAPTDGSELEFFGIKLKVKDPQLAALLNSDVHDDVQVIGRRARDVLMPGEDARAERDDAGAERDVAARVLHADDSVTLRLDEAEAP